MFPFFQITTDFSWAVSHNMVRLEEGIPEDMPTKTKTQRDDPKLPLIHKSSDWCGCFGTGKKDENEKSGVSEESSWRIGLQVFFPFITAGFGMIFAGMLLDVVQVGRVGLVKPLACCLISYGKAGYSSAGMLLDVKIGWHHTVYVSKVWNHTMDLLWEKFQWILPLYMKPISFQSKASVVCSVTAAIFIDFCLKKLNVFSQHIGKKTNEYLNSAEQIPRNWNVDQLSVLITSWDIT